MIRSVNNRTRKARANQGNERRGTYIVEFSVCLPVLLLFLFASWEFSRFFFVRQSLNHAAYEAARTLVDLDSNEQEAEDKASGILNAANLQLAEMQVVEGSVGPDTSQVTVIITAEANNHWSPLNYFAGYQFTVQSTLDHENESGGL